MRRETALAVPLRRLSISSHVGTIHSWNVCRSRKSQKTLKPPILGVQNYFTS